MLSLAVGVAGEVTENDPGSLGPFCFFFPLPVGGYTKILEVLSLLFLTSDLWSGLCGPEHLPSACPTNATHSFQKELKKGGGRQ